MIPEKDYMKDSVTIFVKKNNFRLSNRGNEEIIIFVLFNDMLSNDRKELIFQSVKKIIEEGK